MILIGKCTRRQERADDKKSAGAEYWVEIFFAQSIEVEEEQAPRKV
jgi:hypothetical protein